MEEMKSQTNRHSQRHCGMVMRGRWGERDSYRKQSRFSWRRCGKARGGRGGGWGEGP